jgi:DNA ligase (NAD+)
MNKELLTQQIENARRAYYNTDTPIMPDDVYDTLINELTAIDPDHPLLQEVGSRPMGVTFKHNIPPGSQEKLKDKETFDKWLALTQSLGCRRYAKGHKLDGLTVVLDYNNGLLVRALLRGDGLYGEDITTNALQMKNVKIALPAIFTGSLRGEMMLSKNDFKTYFAPLDYSNPRNSASGVSRDQKGTGLHKHLKVIYFDMVGDDGCATEEERLRYMANELELEVVMTDFFDSAEELWNSWTAMVLIFTLNEPSFPDYFKLMEGFSDLINRDYLLIS